MGPHRDVPRRILYEERLAIEQACVNTAPNWYPTATYIVVTKRHHTRFFLKGFSQGTEANGFNISPGTLVEDTVTTNETMTTSSSALKSERKESLGQPIIMFSTTPGKSCRLASGAASLTP